MADSQRSSGLVERDVDQAITALKKGSYLLKYGRRGKPKFCPFQLSSDESTLVWYSGKEEKHLKLNQVSKIIPGQRTAIFQRYPRPEKEYQSFSLIYSDRSLDLICKDKDEAEVWFVGLKALITRGKYQSKWRIDTRSESVSSESPRIHTQRISPQFDQGFADDQGIQVPVESTTQNRFGKVISEILSQTTAAKNQIQAESVVNPFSSLNAGCIDNPNARTSASDTVRVSLSSAVSSSSQGSFHEDFDALGDVFIWGEGIGDGILGGGVHKIGKSSKTKVDALLPKALESTVVLDVSNIACGSRHAVLVTKQGEIFSWGEDSGGRLGHGIESDVPHPKLIGTLSGMSVELVACGEYHTCAVTLSGELYTWGDGTHNSGLLGHKSEASHWIPKKVSGDMDGIHVSYISCGPWHTSAVTSAGQLFTFGDGTFGALGHGDRRSTIVPREVDALRGLRTTRVACGVWHTAAVVEVTPESSREGLSESHSAGQLFTWGDGDEGRLGHGDKEPRLVPECVAALLDKNICQVACGNNLTVALTAAGQVYTMGSTAYGQLGNPMANGKVPALVEGKIADNFVEEIACGSFHVAVLTSKTEVYTWGKGKNGQLGHGDNEDRHKPTLVHFLKEKQVKTVVCGSNVTAVICLHKWVSSTDHSVCSGCRNPFGFRRKRHNCYNCGLVFCKWCSSKKCLKAALAPNMNKPYRVCDECFNKLKKAAESSTVVRIPKPRTGEPKTRTGDVHHKTNETANRGVQGPILLTHITRLKSAGISSQAESWHPKQDIKQAFDNGRVFPASIGNFQLGGSYSLKVSTFLDGAKKKTITNSTPNLKISSHAASLSGMARPASSPELTRNDSKQKRDNASEEIAMLRAQVEDLTVKAQHLEAELERKSRQLKEVTAIASNEAEKCKSAREVIKSLTAQLTEMSERLPEEQRAIAKDSSLVQKFSSSESHSANAVSREVESNGNSTDNRMLSYGTKAQNEKPLCTIQAEPGVYITLSSTPGGQNELKRVRFSRRQFTEQQAEKWWAEHGAKVCEQHNIQSTE